MEKIYRAVKYLRTSRPDNETEHRDSIENQRRLINAYLQSRQDIIAVSEQVDDGFSGLFFERSGFKAMLAEIHVNQVDCVIVKDLSRLGRDYIEVGRLLRDFFPIHQVRLISLDDHIDSIQLDGFDKMFALLKSIFSEQYCQDISLKTRSALEIMCKQGCYMGAIPIYGYQRSVDNKYLLEPDAHTAEVVCSIFQRKLRGMSAGKIADALNERKTLSPLAYKRKQGIPCPSGGFSDKPNPLWSATTVLRILKDETYTGTLVQRKRQRSNYKALTTTLLAESQWLRTEQAHKAIISKHDYDTVQRLLELDTRSAPTEDAVYLFSGILVCGCCGKTITRKKVKHHAKKYIYYCCPAKKSNGCGFRGMMPESYLHRLVLLKLKEHITHVAKRLPTISHKQIWDKQRTVSLAKIVQVEDEIRHLNYYRQTLSEVLLAGVITETELYKLQSCYDDKIRSLEKETAKLRRETLVIVECLNDFTGWAEELRYFNSSKQLTRDIVVKTINHITVMSKTKLEICFKHEEELNYITQNFGKGGHEHGTEK